jgi:hypothetical protein
MICFCAVGAFSFTSALSCAQDLTAWPSLLKKLSETSQKISFASSRDRQAIIEWMSILNALLFNRQVMPHGVLKQLFS